MFPSFFSTLQKALEEKEEEEEEKETKPDPLHQLILHFSRTALTEKRWEDATPQGPAGDGHGHMALLYCIKAVLYK